jgi:hypothetical protein
MMRKQFILPESDREYLDACGLAWETVSEAGSNWLLIHNYPVPTGYNVKKVIVGLMISAGYPEAQIDMAFFSPSLARTDGRVIHAATPLQRDGKTFQQWSRHRTAQNPWRPGEDDVSTHLALVKHWLEKELTR